MSKNNDNKILSYYSKLSFFQNITYKNYTIEKYHILSDMIINGKLENVFTCYMTPNKLYSLLAEIGFDDMNYHTNQWINHLTHKN